MLARRLEKGDKIGIISPSTPITKDMKDRFENGRILLESLGFEVVSGKFVFSKTLRYTAAPEEKAEDINSFFADPSIKMIMSSQGGHTTNACLPFLDWKLIKKNPKPLIGISDVTVLLNAVYAKTGLVTYHGNDLLWGFGNKLTVYEINDFLNKFVERSSTTVDMRSKWKVVRPGKASGKLLGGNLPCFMKLAGTPYFPDCSGAILFFEALDIQPEQCYCFFQQLKQMGIFKQIKGVIIGYNSGLENKGFLEQMEVTLANVSREFNFPILKINEFGHNCSNTVIPVGLKTTMDTDAKVILFSEPVVK